MCELFLLGFLGLSLIGLFAWFIKSRRQVFDTPLLGLLTLGVALVSVAILKPTSIKYGDMAMILKEAKEATSDAQKAATLANETIAMLLWNSGRLDAGGDLEAAKGIIFKTYGNEKGQKILNHFIETGIFKATKEEKKRYQLPKSDGNLPGNLKSPLSEMLLNNPSN